MLGRVIFVLGQSYSQDHLNNYSLQSAAGQSAKPYLPLLSLLLHMQPSFLWITFSSACMSSGQCPEISHLHHVQVSTRTGWAAEDTCEPSQLSPWYRNQLCTGLMSNSTVYNHGRLTWRAESSLWVLNIVCTQTKISTCKRANPLHISGIIGFGYYCKEWMDAVYSNRRWK